MKILAVGDTHGRTNWKQIVANNTFDKIIFIGDYFDTHDDISPEQQKNNFKEIIAYKKQNVDNVELLIGNHDFHYLKGISEHYSGYQASQYFDFQELLQEAIKLDFLKICHIHNNFLFVHAGITKTWCYNHDIDISNLESSINELFKYTPQSFCFRVGANFSMYGDDICQSPIWVRPRSLYIDKIDNYIQVVGHTIQDKLIVNDEIIMIDTLGTSGEYLQIFDNNITAIK